jgi:hypothetical protein
LDFDFVQGPGLSIANVPEYLDRAHAHTKAAFNDLISERYVPFMTGEQQ